MDATNTDFSDLWAKRTERVLFDGSSRTRQEARRLEDKVARVAAKKCSVEEVSSLHKELEAWLTTEMTDDQVCPFAAFCILKLINTSFFLDFPVPQRGSSAGHPPESSCSFRSQSKCQDRRSEPQRQARRCRINQRKT
jgi:hypothetical protein